MSRFNFLSSRKLRSVGLASIVGVSALLVTGCVTVGQYGDHYTESIWHEPSDGIVFNWASPKCDQDIDGDGSRGTPHDRALCAFFIIRGTVCNNINGTPKQICNLATEANGETYYTHTPLWFDFTAAATRMVNNGWACLQIQYGGFGEIRRWTAAPLGYEGCQNAPRLSPTG
jgi:hypothetical protein